MDTAYMTNMRFGGRLYLHVKAVSIYNAVTAAAAAAVTDVT